MRPDLTGRDRRALSGAAVMFAAVVVAPIARRLSLWQASQLAMLQAATQADPLASVRTPMLAALRDSAAARAGSLARIDDELIAGSTADAIGAKLGAEVSRLGDSTGAAMANVQLHVDRRPYEGHVQVAIRVTGTVEVRGLSALLGALDESTKHLVVRDIVVTPASETTPSIRRVMPLRFELLVETIGVLRRPAAER